MNPASVIINPDNNELSRHVCQTHFKAFLAYYEGREDEKPPVKHI